MVLLRPSMRLPPQQLATAGLLNGVLHQHPRTPLPRTQTPSFRPIPLPSTTLQRRHQSCLLHHRLTRHLTHILPSRASLHPLMLHRLRTRHLLQRRRQQLNKPQPSQPPTAPRLPARMHSRLQTIPPRQELATLAPPTRPTAATVALAQAGHLRTNGLLSTSCGTQTSSS